MAGITARMKDHDLLKNRAEVVLTIEPTFRFWLGVRLIIAVMWVASRLISVGLRVEDS